MNEEIIIELNECLQLCRKLENLLCEDREAMSRTVSGAVEREYSAGIDASMEFLANIKNRLYMLLDEQLLML